MTAALALGAHESGKIPASPMGPALRQAANLLADLLKLGVQDPTGDVDLSVLTESQRAAAEGVLASAMAGYVRWLAPRMGDLKRTLQARQRELRARAAGAGARPRRRTTVPGLSGPS